MELKAFRDSDDAVSPVIGVILMVAITVILAAVIAAFVLGLGDQVSDTAPQASFSFEFDEGVTSGEDSWGNTHDTEDGLLTITHEGGATLEASNLAIRGSPNSGGDLDAGTFGSSSEIRAGDEITVWVNSDNTIRVVWISDTGEDSATLREWNGPDA